RFVGDKGFMYKANLSLRTALKILKPLHTSQIESEQDLYDLCYDFPWENYLDVDSSFAIDSVVNGEVFRHSKYAALKAKDGMVDRFRSKYNRRPDVDVENPTLRINLHIQHTTCTLSLDSSGASLHHRGYRTATNMAPINEVLAAGLVQLSDWKANTDFLDPMCGSGTLLIEAAMLACRIPANINRRFFAFEKWLDFEAELFEKIKQSQLQKVINPTVKIIGFDKAPSAVTKAVLNIRNANLTEFITVEQKNFFNTHKESQGPLHLLSNPPYGERLDGDIKALYKSIGNTLKQGYAQTHAWLISANTEALKNIGLRPSRKIKLFNGKLESYLMYYPLYEGTKRIHKLNS
ncbi:MAG: THUMP domain-containing class I SAM-dependent RNA methyltransferase, partial [Flavobacteriaceae bacterium]